MTPFHPPISEPALWRPLRTDAEIDAITKIAGERIWIKNLRDARELDLVEALFEYRDHYELNVISAAAELVHDLHSEITSEHLTGDLLDKVNTIANELYTVLRTEGIGPWFPDEYKKLVRYFTAATDEWESALELIRSRRLTSYDELMRLHEGTKDGTAPALLDGSL